jgi:hypothetical protein
MAVEITLKLPDDLARDAREFGLLENGAIEELLQREVEQRVNALVNQEIHAYRTEKVRKAGSARGLIKMSDDFDAPLLDFGDFVE